MRTWRSEQDGGQMDSERTKTNGQVAERAVDAEHRRDELGQRVERVNEQVQEDVQNRKTIWYWCLRCPVELPRGVPCCKVAERGKL
jgi:hypothetical protein